MKTVPSELERTLFAATAAQQVPVDPFDMYRPTGPEERLSRFFGAAYALYWQAERSRHRARSWRNFCVGCGVFAYREDPPLDAGRFRAFYGMNSKPEKDGRNICAEPIPIDGATAIGYERAIGLVVIGETQEDEGHNIPPTLRPCKFCRQFMRKSPIIMPETIIVTALPPPHPGPAEAPRPQVLPIASHHTPSGSQ